MPIQFDQTSAGVANLGTASGSTSYTLVLPSTTGSSGNYLINDGSGNLSWGSASVNGFSATLNTASPNNTVNVSSLSAAGGTTNQFIALVPSATTGSIIGNIPDGASTGGDSRGVNSVDLQLSRAASGRVAAGTGSVVLGGYNNAASSTYSYNAVLGGSGNIASSSYALIGGGSGNAISTTTSALILGGSGNTVSASYAAILGGRNNTASGSGMILGGYANSGSNIMWNQANPLNLSATNPLIGRSWLGNTRKNSGTYTAQTLMSHTPLNNSVYLHEINFLANRGLPNSATAPCIQRGYYLSNKSSSVSWVAGTSAGAMPFIVNNTYHTASTVFSGTTVSVTVTNTFNNNTTAMASAQYFYIVVA